MNARVEALAFRIWAYAQPKGWDCLMKDVAEALGVSLANVRAVSTVKDWSGRFRVAKADTSARFGSFNFKRAHDEEINKLADQMEADVE